MTRDDSLTHFGVKGMKWGIQKQKDIINSKDRVISKGTNIQNISSREFVLGKRHLYVSYTKYDNAEYANLMGNTMYDKSYMNKMVVKKTLDYLPIKSLLKTLCH